MADPLTTYDILHGVTNGNPSGTNAFRVIGTTGVGPSGKAWDYLAVTYPSATQEVYTFKTGGAGGSSVATATVDYTDSTKASLLDVVWT